MSQHTLDIVWKTHHQFLCVHMYNNVHVRVYLSCSRLRVPQYNHVTVCLHHPNRVCVLGERSPDSLLHECESGFSLLIIIIIVYLQEIPPSLQMSSPLSRRPRPLRDAAWLPGRNKMFECSPRRTWMPLASPGGRKEEERYVLL